MSFLKKLFGGGNSDVSQLSAPDDQTLLMMGLKHDYRGLARYMKHPDAEVRKKVIDFIVMGGKTNLQGGSGHFKANNPLDSTAINLLIQALNDADESVQLAALKVLEEESSVQARKAVESYRQRPSKNMAKAGSQSAESKPPQKADLELQDARVPIAISALMVNVKLSTQFNEIGGTGSDGPVMEAANLFKELHDSYPDSPLLHFSWAAALQIAAQGETASTILAECVDAHPDFWLARAVQKQNALLSWNPFLLPEFNPENGILVHEIINRMVSTNILVATRLNLMPRAVIFLRDANDEFFGSKLSSCKIEFATTISSVSSPQVVAINGRIHDDPVNPYQCELLQCPIQSFGSKERLPYELFVQQADYDFVVLDKSGRVKYVRRMQTSDRMKATHQRLMQMFETTDGSKPSMDELVSAIRRHQSVFGPEKVVY